MRLRTLTVTTTAATLLLAGCSGTSTDEPADETPAAEPSDDSEDEAAEEVEEVEEVEVPDVVGMSSTDASAALREAGLTANPSEGPAAETPDDVGRVAEQDPEAGASVEPGTVVDVIRYGEPAYAIVDGPIVADISEITLGELGDATIPGIAEEYSGSGDDIVDLEAPFGVAAVRSQHQGSRNVTVRAVYEDGSDDLVVNGIGNYSGEALADGGGSDLTAFDISADGPWTIQALHISQARDSDDVGRSYTGTGDALIVFPFDPEDPQPITEFSRATFTHQGERNVTVRELLGPLVVNDIGNYDGTVRLSPEGQFGFEVRGDGPWTLTLE